MNTLLTLQFNGTRYHGFQVQKNVSPTVCGEVQNAMEKVFGHRPDVTGSSRTDAGVHASGYCLNFHGEIKMPYEKLPLALNAHLPLDIRVVKAQAVCAPFHARYWSGGKEYIYRLYNSPVESPFHDGFSWRVPGEVDVAAMQSAAAVLVGTHNFASFMAAGGNVAKENATRTVHGLFVEQDEKDPKHITIRIQANGYLYNMVRIIAGTLVQVGRGKTAPGELAGILHAQDRETAGPTAPAKGLFLSKVFYPKESFDVTFGGPNPLDDAEMQLGAGDD